jgi:hypothetical protein
MRRLRSLAPLVIASALAAPVSFSFGRPYAPEESAARRERKSAERARRAPVKLPAAEAKRARRRARNLAAA